MYKKIIATLATPLLCLLPTQLKAYPDTPENHTIALRHKMEEAVSTKEKRAILEQIGQQSTFQGMVFISNYIGEKKLRKAAAKAAAEIILQHPEFNGTNVRVLLKSAMPYLGKEERKAAQKYIEDNLSTEEGFVSIFNGKDLTGWKGLVANPIKRAQMSAEELASAQEKADEQMYKDWQVVDGLLTYVGKGFDNLCTVRQYSDFEMYVDWRLDPSGAEPDAGIYLRGTPQVQIWDIARVNVGAQVGSGGLYNNQKNESKPLCVADNKLGEWNSFYIKMVGDKVTVKLNGVTVVDNVVLENYWDRSQPIFPCEQIEMQAHGSLVNFRDIYVKELR